ncbi:MAG: AEC family transporter [Proteobacteria bacterium]|nr:AEC family transporter [Pseudomonadota bacterium]
MSNLVLIFVSLICGYLFRRTDRLPATTSQALNSFIIFMSLPALVLLQITNLFKTLEFQWNYLLPISMPWIVFGLSWLFFSQLGRKRNWTRARTGALILISGLGNTSFVGIPLLEGIVGPEAVAWGVLIDQLGSFLVLSTLGLLVASLYGKSRGAARSPLRQTLSFPPFIALVTALVLGMNRISFEGVTGEILQRISLTLVPLALFSVGFQLKLNLSTLKRYLRPLSLSLFYKMVFCPLFFLTLVWILRIEIDLVTRVMILEAAMATMITSAVVVSEFSLDEELANLMVGVSILISLASVPLWDKLIAIL